MTLSLRENSFLTKNLFSRFLLAEKQLSLSAPFPLLPVEPCLFGIRLTCSSSAAQRHNRSNIS